MTQLVLEADSRTTLKPFAQAAKQQGIVCRYVAPKPKEKKPANPNNPSPRGDPWWDEPKNMALVMERVERIERGEAKWFTEETSPVIREFRAMGRDRQGKERKQYVRS